MGPGVDMTVFLTPCCLQSTAPTSTGGRWTSSTRKVSYKQSRVFHCSTMTYNHHLLGRSILHLYYETVKVPIQQRLAAFAKPNTSPLPLLSLRGKTLFPPSPPITPAAKKMNVCVCAVCVQRFLWPSPVTPTVTVPITPQGTLSYPARHPGGSRVLLVRDWGGLGCAHSTSTTSPHGG